MAGGFGELAGQLGGGGVADPAALLAGGQPEADEQVGFAGAGVAEQHGRLAGVDPGTGGEGSELRCDAGDHAGAEVSQPLDAGEAGFGDAAGAAAAGPVVDFGGQDLGEVAQVGVAFADGGLGEPGGVGADGGQFQLAGGGADRGQGRGVGHAAHRVPPVSSWS